VLTRLQLSIGLQNTSLHLIVAIVVFKLIDSVRSIYNYVVTIMVVL